MPNTELENALTEAASDDTSDEVTLVIDNDLRTIACPTGYVLGVYNDKDVLSVNFKMPRYYDDIDLKTFGIRVNYINANGIVDYYPVMDPKVNSKDITFEWLLGRSVFEREGTVRFSVCLRKFNGQELVKEFNTTIASGIVLQGLEIEDDTALSPIARLRFLIEASESTGRTTIGTVAYTTEELTTLLNYLE